MTASSRSSRASSQSCERPDCHPQAARLASPRGHVLPPADRSGCSCARLGGPPGRTNQIEEPRLCQLRCTATTSTRTSSQLPKTGDPSGPRPGSPHSKKQTPSGSICPRKLGPELVRSTVQPGRNETRLASVRNPGRAGPERITRGLTRLKATPAQLHRNTLVFLSDLALSQSVTYYAFLI